MTYKEQIHAVLGFMYNETKCFATSSTYHIPYNTIVNAYNIQIANKKVQDDIKEEWCDSKYMDKIQALDFDDTKEEVIVMIWETNAKKKYTLNNYEEFCKDALIMPPFEDDEQIEEWFDTHKIHIIANGCDMELEYDADTINEIEFSLKEIHRAILGDGTPTTGNTITKRVATMKDLVQYYLLDSSMEYSDKEFSKYVKNIFDVNWVEFYESIVKNESYDEYKEWIDCDFRTFDARTFTIDRDKLKEIVLSLVGTNYEIRTDGEIAFIIDHTLKIPGIFINWFYGADDKDEDLDEIAKDYIEMYKKELFKEEE